MSTIIGEEIKVINVKRNLVERQVLFDDRIKEFTKTFLKVETIFKYPQDINYGYFNQGQ